MPRKLGAIAIVALIAAAIFWQVRHRVPPAQHLTPKNAVPQFSLTDIHGGTIDSAQLRGKVVLVDFWAMWCPPCESEIPQFVDWQNRYGARGLQVIGLSMDDAEPPVRSYAEEHKIPYPIAMADEKSIAALGGVLGLPAYVLIDRDGRLIAKHVGESEMQSLQQEIEQALAVR